MDFLAILDGIKTEGQLQIQKINDEAENRIAEINRNAENTAGIQRKRILSDGRARLNRECALIDQQASVQCLKIHADARQSLIDIVLNHTQVSFQHIRERKDYTDILSSLIEEVIDSLLPSLLKNQTIILHFDNRDEMVIKKIIKNQKHSVELQFDIKTNGGCIGETGDGLVKVLNTIESRFERANSLIQQKLSVFFEEKARL